MRQKSKGTYTYSKIHTGELDIKNLVHAFSEGLQGKKGFVVFYLFLGAGISQPNR